MCTTATLREVKVIVAWNTSTEGRLATLTSSLSRSARVAYGRIIGPGQHQSPMQQHRHSLMCFWILMNNKERLARSDAGRKSGGRLLAVHEVILSP